MVRTEADGLPGTVLSPARCSVVIVNYNGGELLLQCISALQQSTLPLEIILVDNASSDGSASEAEACCRSLRLIRNPSNLGFAVAANQGLGVATADHLLLLNPDCILSADTIEKMLAVMQSHEDAGMAGCRILNPDGSEQRGCRRMLPTLSGGLGKALGRQQAMDLHLQAVPDAPGYVEAISGAFMLLRRDAMEAVGLLDERYFMHCEDLDWCRRFIDAGWKILFVPQVEVIHHQGACSKAAPVKVSWYKHQGMIRYYRKFLAKDNGLVATLVVIPSIYARFAGLALLSAMRRVLGGS